MSSQPLPQAPLPLLAALLRRGVAVVALTLATALAAVQAAEANVADATAVEAPDAMVRRVADEVVAIIKADPLVKAGDQARIREVVETKLLPSLDFNRMTRLAMGRNWRTATPEQKQQLEDQFRTLLVRTYSGVLSQYQNEELKTKPLRASADDTDITVRTEVVRVGRPPIQIDYGMEKKPDGWKVYDVIVGGVSLVTNYREEFNAQIQEGGVDGLITVLTQKNQGPPPPPPTTPTPPAADQ